MSRSPSPSDAGSHASGNATALPGDDNDMSHEAQQAHNTISSSHAQHYGDDDATTAHGHRRDGHDAVTATMSSAAADGMASAADTATGSADDAPTALSATAPSSQPQEQRYTSLFIGLGPAARVIAREELLRFIQSRASNPDLIGDVRLRGRCAFADIKTLEEANRLVTALDGEMFEDKCRLAVQLSKNPRREDGVPSSSSPMFRGPRMGGMGRYDAVPHGPHGGRLPSLFIGLGPAGEGIPDNEIRAKLEEAAPLTAFRRRGQCAFVEVANAEHADRLMSMMNNQYIGQARISVQYSRDNYKRDRERGVLGAPRSRDDYYNNTHRFGAGVDRYPSDRYRRGSGRDRSRSRSHGRDELTRHRHRRYRSRSNSVASSRGDRRRRRHRSRSASTVSSRPRYASRSRSHSRPRARSPAQGPPSRASSASRERRSHRHRSARHA